MMQKFNNYIIKNGKVIISLEKDIYNKDMIDGAKQALTDECQITLSDKEDIYEITLTPKTKGTDLEDMAISFNDTVISSFNLY